MKIKEFTKTGNYNNLRGVRNQDYICAKENKSFFVMALADGVTSCAKGGEGAQIACKAASDMLIRSDKWFGFEKEKIACLILEEVLFQIKKEANKNNEHIESYASTLVIAFFDKIKKRLLVFNLGDGAVFLSFLKESGYELFSPPKRRGGQPTLIPYLNAYKDAQIDIIDGFNGKIFICSDGAFEILDKNHIDINTFVREAPNWDFEDDGSFLLCET